MLKCQYNSCLRKLLPRSKVNFPRKNVIKISCCLLKCILYFFYNGLKMYFIEMLKNYMKHDVGKTIYIFIGLKFSES